MVSEVATAEKIERGYLGTVLRLTLPAPEIGQAVLERRQFAVQGLPQRPGPCPMGWVVQREALRECRMATSP